jgi:L-aspartate oxidase
MLGGRTLVNHANPSCYHQRVQPGSAGRAFMTLSHKTHHADYVVVGCGVAGLRAAIELSGAGSVLVLAKSNLNDSATAWAQAGVTVALSDEDKIALHEQDTLDAGEGLCRPEAVALLVEEGPRYITQLMGWSREFDRGSSKLEFTRETASSRARILHANGGSTGREISRALLGRAHTIAHLHLRAHAFTTELMVEAGRVAGVRFIDETDGSRHEAHAAAVLLATGGLGQIYRETTNPEAATGDGMAIAYEAGAVLCDMEFVQFHPTALAVKGAPRFLLAEALRCEGGVLRNVDLERFMKRYNEAQELAPREVVTRAMVSEMQRTHSDHVYLDMTKKNEEYLKQRFPLIYATCATYGLDLAADLAPVCPAAHYMMGGIKTDLWGRTSLPGLYAAGETAATGVHGANRLVSNSLLEGLVFGARTGAAMLLDAPVGKRSAAGLPGSPAPKPGEGKIAASAAAAAKSSLLTSAKNAKLPPAAVALITIRDVMWTKVGILRSARELAEAIRQLEALELPLVAKPGRAESELRNARDLALLIARSGAAREESRGSHYRADFPYRDDENFAKHSAVRKGEDVRFEP